MGRIRSRRGWREAGLAMVAVWAVVGVALAAHSVAAYELQLAAEGAGAPDPAAVVPREQVAAEGADHVGIDRKSTRLNSSH